MTKTAAAVRQWAQRRPDATALLLSDASVSYRALLDRAERSAGLLLDRDLRAVALLADNSEDWVVCDLAAQIAGTALVPLPGFFSKQQALHALRDSGADALVVDQAHEAFAIRLGLVAKPAFLLTRQLRAIMLEKNFGRRALADGTAKLSYTSGTTGEPKGVRLSQATMDRVADSLCRATRELELRRHFALLPFPTLLENIAGIYAPLQNGTEIAISPLAQIGWRGAAQLDIERLIAAVRQYRPDSMIMVPQILAALVHAIEEHGASLPDSLRFIAVGGGHVARSLLERAEGLGLPVFEGYGLTECASVVALNTPAHRRPGSVGKPLAHCDVRVGANGEILVSAATERGPDATDGRSGGVIATGDIGHIDEEGYLYIRGRRKNVFITSFGRNVSPEWVEAECLQQRSVAQIAVFGEARPWNVAVVVAGPGASATEVQAAVEAVNEGLPDYARIDDWIAATEPFTPSNGLSTPNGKNRRNAIWDSYRTRIESRYSDCLNGLMPLREQAR